MKIDLLPCPFFLHFLRLALTLSLLSSCSTTPGSGPQGSTPADANASVDHGSSSSVNERNSPKAILPANDEPAESNALDSSVGEPGLASDAKKNPDEGKSSEKVDDQKANGTKGAGPSNDQSPVSSHPVPEREGKENSVVPPKTDNEGAENATILPLEEPEREEKEEPKTGVAGGKAVEPELDSTVHPQFPNPPVTPSGLSGQPKDDEKHNATATDQGTAAGISLGDVFQPEVKNEKKDDRPIEPGNVEVGVITRPSVEIDLPDPPLGTDGRAGNEPEDGPDTRLPIDPVENEGDPESANHASEPGVQLPRFSLSPTGERLDPQKSIELGDGEKLVPKGALGSGRYVIFGDDSTEPDETGRDARKIELSTDNFRRISVPGNQVGESAGKSIVWGNEEYVAPQRLPKRNTQFKSPGRDSVLILRRPDSGNGNDLARGGAEKSDERQFDRLKELFEKRSGNSDHETFSDSEKREFKKIRELIESKEEHKPVDEDGKALPNRYLNALEWLRSKGRGASGKKEDRVED